MPQEGRPRTDRDPRRLLGAGWLVGRRALLRRAAHDLHGGHSRGLPWASASVMAVGAAIISILTTAVEYASKPLKQASYWNELALRLVKTFASSLLGAMTAEAALVNQHTSREMIANEKTPSNPRCGIRRGWARLRYRGSRNGSKLGPSADACVRSGADWRNPLCRTRRAMV